MARDYQRGVAIWQLKSTRHGENGMRETGARTGAELCGGAAAFPLAVDGVIMRETVGETVLGGTGALPEGRQHVLCPPFTGVESKEVGLRELGGRHR